MMLDLLLEPLQLAFMQRALAATLLVGVLCGSVGVYVVLRGLAFLGEAFRHSMFAGVVVAFLAGGSMVVGGLLAGLLAALLVSLLGRQRQVGEGTAIGILYTGMFALGVVLLGFAQTGVRDMARLLLGNVLGISTTDLALTALVTLVVLGTLVYLHKELVLLSFDPLGAAAQGLPVGVLQAVLLGLMALAVTAAYVTVGNLMVLALLLAPAATARLLVRSVAAMLVTSALLGVLAGIIGLYLSYYANVPSGATIVLVSVGLFLLTWLAAPGTGVLAGALRTLRRT